MYRKETRFWGWKLSKKVLRLQRFSETLAEFKALVGVKTRAACLPCQSEGRLSYPKFSQTPVDLCDRFSP